MTGKTASAGLVLAILLIPTIANSLGQTKANPIGSFYPWSPPPYPVLSVDSPINGTIYAEATVPLFFNVSTAYTWTGYYLLDNDKNHEYLPNCQPIQCWLDGAKIGEFTWNLTAAFSANLTGLAAGQHTLQLNGSVTGEYMKSINRAATIINYVANGTSKLINFTTLTSSLVRKPEIVVDAPTPVPSELSPDQNPLAETPSPSPTPTTSESSLPSPSASFSTNPSPSVPEFPTWMAPISLVALLVPLGVLKRRSGSKRNQIRL